MKPKDGSEWGSGRSILFVDDDPNVLFLLQEYFKNSSFIIETAKNGEEGIVKSKQKFFHLVMTDICMPVLDGNALLRFIKMTSPSTLVVGMSADLDKLESPCDGVISKPFSCKIVVSMLRNLLIV